MLIKLRNRMAREESGFTLVELLVVMLILGILAAIAIPTFFNQRDKARDADAKTGARTAETAMETLATENGGDYSPGSLTPAQVAARLSQIEPTLQTSRLTVSYPAGEEYAVTYSSTNTPNTFTITRHTNGTKSASCVNDGNDGCPTGGNWFGS